MDSKFKNNNYIVIQGWMINELNLKGNELLCYAVIYGFPQSDDNSYQGSLSYLASAISSSKSTVLRCLKCLEEKELIFKNEYVVNNVKLCSYSVSDIKFFRYCQNDTTIVKMTPNNIDFISSNNNLDLFSSNNDENKEVNILNNNNISQNSKKFKKPTIEELNEYIIKEHLNVNAEQFLNYYESVDWYVGKKRMSNWKAACRTWNSKSKSNCRNSNISKNYVSDGRMLTEKQRYYTYKFRNGEFVSEENMKYVIL